jgi:hypothetical protein
MLFIHLLINKSSSPIALQFAGERVLLRLLVCHHANWTFWTTFLFLVVNSIRDEQIGDYYDKHAEQKLV